jgi:hypothetical protein
MKSLALAILVAGCGANTAAQSRETLADSIRIYNDGVRWQRFTMAASLLPERERGRFADEMDQRANEVKITDYEIVRVDTKADREATVHVKLSWYKESEGKLLETHAVQTWEHRGKSWLMVDEARLRGAEMPGLPEPTDSPTPPGTR